MSSDERKQAASEKVQRLGDSGGKVFAPDSPVEVPRMPPKPDEATTTQEASRPTAPAPEAAANSSAPGNAPARIDTTESNWADSTQPAPDKRTARSSIL